MLPYWNVLEILKFVTRNDLERLQVTNRVLNDIINKDFASYPLRVMDDTWAHVQIRSGESVLSIQKSCQCFVPRTRQWKNCKTQCSNPPKCEHVCLVYEMRPFLSKIVRFKHVTISIDVKHMFTPVLPYHIAALELISHIWDGRDLHIREKLQYQASSLKRMLGSSSLLRCRILRMENHRKGSYYYRTRDKFDFEITKQKFLESQDRCRLHLIIIISYSENISEFRLENNRTNEVLQLKHISYEEAIKLDVAKFYGSALLLERYPA
ncbi:hypothetical protein Ddc_23529 [Ditylenchus destructor]|nr:hypothetical protein Ddc_23529 [Ditylenchus destructor]